MDELRHIQDVDSMLKKYIGLESLRNEFVKGSMWKGCNIVEISIVEISVKVSALLAAWPGLKTRIEFDLNYNKL